MRLNRSTHRSSTVNLVPMMDVLMTVLTFFVILSMSLSAPQIADIQLPRNVPGKADPSEKITPLMLGLDAQGQIIQGNQVMESAELVKLVQTYFQKQSNGKVLLVADRTLSYGKVTQVLQGLRRLGATEVSLAVQPE
ncbi:ExbD/TolR family protein [Lyngbya confervoides]|uniref:Biopolymer transporter ExbD n=1 Tax=Lyngbya confervoides BDU141951 TaxID=1574623 RepID=A0ABD4TB43_9CYAN|nr:biopolymer transporter ExbD [Lyngbya confervoides]MCM1985265.1 biopolymer transporter ExbD [Lyngbya confervoides BDU141951]